MKSLSRIYSLDLLRGLMAILIMVYHYTSWSMGGFWGQRFVAVFGIYGVAIFYVLSGLTLYLVYESSLDLRSLSRYALKRVLRIYPLLILSILLTVFMLDREHDWDAILLNVSGLFGFVDPDNYIAIGSWSIGNELVYYALFPVVLIGARYLPYWTEIMFVVALGLAGWYAVDVLDAGEGLHGQWHRYVEPFNHWFLFVGGMLIGKYGVKLKASWIAWGLLITSVFFFVFYPVASRIELATGWGRFMYSFAALSLVLSVYRIPDLQNDKLRSVSLSLGRWSYGIYLLHPIVFFAGAYLVNRRVHPELYLIGCILITLVVSGLVYRYFERPFLLLGKKKRSA